MGKQSIFILPFLFGLAACGGGGSGDDTTTTAPNTPTTPTSYSKLSDASVSSATSVAVLKGSPTVSASSVSGSFDHSAQSVRPNGGSDLATNSTLTSGLDYVIGITGTAGEQLALVPTTLSDMPSGTAVYNGKAAINIVSSVNNETYDDPSGTSRVTIDFANPRNATGVFAITSGSTTNSSGVTTPNSANGTVTVTSLGVISGDLTGNSADVAISGISGANLSGASVTAVGGVAGPQAAEIGGIISSSDSDTSVLITFAGQK